MSPIELKKARWGFTCENCPYRSSRYYVDDYIRWKTGIDTSGNSTFRSLNVKYPKRCRECERQKKRYQRMRKTLDTIWSYCWSLPGSIYKRPKIITFGLPSSPTERSDSSVKLNLLKSKMKDALVTLRHHGIRGGVYVTEMTSRLCNLDYYEDGFMKWKHHAHVHMVCVAPFKNKESLNQLNECLKPLGLGYVYYEAPRGHWKQAKKHIARYIAKYLSKQGHRKRRFGVLLDYTPETLTAKRRNLQS